MITENENDIKHGISHDIKNLLSNISNLCILFFQIEQENRSEDALKITQMILRLSQESLFLLSNSNYLDNKVPRKVESKFLILNDLISDRAIWLYKHNAKSKKIRFVLKMPRKRLMVWFNEIDFFRMLDNLVSNAIKFTPLGGKVVLTAQTKDKTILISVMDTGIGIPLNHQKELFTSNLATKRRGTNNELSSGIGLVVVKKIVDENGGAVWFDSDLKKGTTFYVALPKGNKLIDLIDV